MASAEQWVQWVLEDGLYPQTNVNYTGLTEWGVAETADVDLKYNNPLNASDPPPANVFQGYIPGTQIPIYPNMKYAADEYIFKFRSNLYISIHQALMLGTSLYGLWVAINRSDWRGSKLAGTGTYPTPLYNLLNVPGMHVEHRPASASQVPAYTDAGVAPLNRDMRKHWDELMRQLHVILPQQLRKGIKYRVAMRNSLNPTPDKKG